VLAAVALFVMPEPIIRLIYERGAFGPETTEKVAAVLGLYALGLPAFVLIKVFSPGYFARENTKTPMIITGISALANTALSVVLFWSFAERGIAMATTLAGWINALLLFEGLRRQGLWHLDGKLVRRVLLVLVSAGLMGGALLVMLQALERWMGADPNVIHQSLAVLLLAGVAMLIYFALAFATGAADRSLVMKLVRRKRAAG